MFKKVLGCVLHLTAGSIICMRCACDLFMMAVNSRSQDIGARCASSEEASVALVSNKPQNIAQVHSG